jgi:hypothetical protein
MSSLQEIKALGMQPNMDLVVEGVQDSLKQTLLGQIPTADWKALLAMFGKMYKVHIGAIAAGSDVTQITGGGDGTVPDIEQPEIIVGVDAGYTLIPIELDGALSSDTDAPNDYMSAMLLGDRTNAPPTSVTGTVTTPINVLDGAAAFPGRAFTAITSDITDPVLDDLLFYRRRTQVELVLNGSSTNVTAPVVGSMDIHWEAHYPNLMAGPCSLVFWYAGTVAVTGLATMTFACVPSAWFPTS